MTLYATVRAAFPTTQGGKMICIPAGYKATSEEVQQHYTGRHWVIMLKNSDHVMVQVYSTNEGEGMVEGDAIQNGNVLTIDFKQEVSGYPVLVKPKMVKRFTNEATWTCNHNYGHWVCAQVFIDDEGQAFADIHNVDDNTVKVYFSEPVSGYLLVA